MPLYLVRWPNISASIVHAEDEDELCMILDELGDPGAAMWEEYEGPLWVEFNPKWRERESGGFEIDDSEFCEETGYGEVLRASVAETDTGEQMYRELTKRLFPHLHRAIEQTCASGMSEEAVKARLREALEREQWQGELLEQRERRSRGDEPAIMEELGVSLVAKISELEDGPAQLAAQQQDELTWRAILERRLEQERRRARADESKS